MGVEIVAEISSKSAMIAEITYRTGFHVEVRVTEQFEHATVRFALSHSDNRELSGTWERALDYYFNEGRFDSKDAVFPGEMRRVGSARDHRLLFLKAVRSLSKDLEPHGYDVRLRYS
jgi:hypothetical protein